MYNRNSMPSIGSVIAVCFLAAMVYSKTASAEGGSLAWFANEAYAKAPKHSGSSKVVFTAGPNRDVTVWRTGPTKGYNPVCVVAWRGSVTKRDWSANIKSQKKKLQPIVGAGAAQKAGYGFVERFNEHRAEVAKWVAPCKGAIHITGHSLGGAVALIHLASLGGKSAGTEAYNPAAPGNRALYNALKGYKAKGYCRRGDGVPLVPAGNVGYCTEPVAKFKFRPHKMTHWPRLPITFTENPIPLI
jgi:hypothetical protein